jgi:hypothetical protein
MDNGLRARAFQDETMAQQVNTAPERAALAVNLGVSWDDGLVAGRRTVARAMAPSPVFATRFAVHDDSVPAVRLATPPLRLFPRSLEGGEFLFS